MAIFKRLALVAFLSASVAACGGPYALTTNEQGTTELGARDFFERSGGAFTSCSGSDSDGDKYVTCTGKVGDNPAFAVLCSYEANARGCKPK